MYAGDFRNCLENVRRELRRLKYPFTVDYAALLRGHQSASIDIYRHLFCEYSQTLSKHLSDKGFDLTGMSDKKFMETVYRCLRDLFTYRPSLTLMQFFASGFAERKMEMLVSISQVIRQYNDNISKPLIKKSVHTRAILETLNTRSKDSEPEIIEINPEEKDRPSSKSVKKTRPRSAPSGDAKSRNRIVCPKRLPFKDKEVKQYIPVVNKEVTSNDTHVPLNVIDSFLPLRGPQSDNATQTFNESHNKVLENISSKLENIFARITVLESRMSLIEDKLPDRPGFHSGNNEDSNIFQSPPYTGASKRSQDLSHRLISERMPCTNRRPVEAVVINQTNQTSPSLKLLRFYEKDPSDRIPLGNSMPPKSDRIESPRHYSPTLYRVDVDEQRDKPDAASNEDCDSNVTSEESNTFDIEPNSRKDNSQPDDHPEQEYPVKLSEIQPDTGADTFQLQVERIQEMIKSTNILLNKT